jgi:hypothetical protein
VKQQIQLLETILAKLSKEILSWDELQNILNPVESPEKLIEDLSIATALKFWNGEMPYSKGDLIINRLFSYWSASESFDKNRMFAGIAWEVYLAFDAGEFYRPGEDRGINPSEKYTMPLVETILRKQKQII